jgi:hypothetical protein
MRGIIVLLMIFVIYYILFKPNEHFFQGEKQINNYVNYVNYLLKGMDNKVSVFPN